ncbi:MAG: LamG domain-containing protein, partial [Planctomycetaceae bacterium]|nr:LamG domain-containing protein [Planctomycetaceae bacterium]
MMLRFTTVISATLLAVVAPMVSADELQPAAAWDFEDRIPGESHGAVSLQFAGLQQPVYPEFADGNQSLTLEAPSWVSLPDDTETHRFDFDNGDVITCEAWVQLKSAGENVCIVSKGRTGTSGTDSINQNWAFRLRQNKGRMCVNFLFRSRDTEESKGDWHRWTSDEGFSSGSRWHHVAVSYKFGDPESIRGFVDGKQVKGSWDMGGATKQPPVVDDAEVWIGSTMGGNKGNSLNGAVDNLRIYRGELPAETLSTRFRWVPPEIKPPTIPRGKVVVQLFGPVDSISEMPQETDAPVIEWLQDEMAFVRLPHKYDDWGVREDWGKTMLVRAWADVVLPQGSLQLLVRSRGL